VDLKGSSTDLGKYCKNAQKRGKLKICKAVVPENEVATESISVNMQEVCIMKKCHTLIKQLPVC
jgi:hypothetical protein